MLICVRRRCVDVCVCVCGVDVEIHVYRPDFREMPSKVILIIVIYSITTRAELRISFCYFTKLHMSGSVVIVERIQIAYDAFSLGNFK